MPMAPRLSTQVRTAIRDIQTVKAQFPGQATTDVILMLILCEVREIMQNTGGVLIEWPEDNT